jgi:hypothetical protein
MTVSLRTAVSALALSLLAASAAHAQTMRATCDNRQGRCFADVIDSSDATEFSYNVDPSEIFRTYAALNQTVTQNVGGNLSTASISVNSRFLGSNPSTRITGFVLDNVCSAQVTRAGTNVRAFSNDTTDVCFTVSGASTVAPLRLRLNIAMSTVPAGATSTFQLLNPSGGVISFLSNVPATNRNVFLTANGQYRITSTLNSGDLQPTTNSTVGPRMVNIYGGLVCLADFDASGSLSVQDIFGYINAWFAGSLAADTNNNGTIVVQDIFDYLSTWFAGCN